MSRYKPAFLIPLMAIVGLIFKGVWVWATPIFAFVCIPILELVFPIDNKNLEPNEVDTKLKKTIFDWLLYFNLPVVYSILIYGLLLVSTSSLETYTLALRG